MGGGKVVILLPPSMTKIMVKHTKPLGCDRWKYLCNVRGSFFEKRIVTESLKKFQHFKGLESSLPCTHQLTNGVDPDPDDLAQILPIHFKKIRFNTILPDNLTAICELTV
jgi:hypothetical protein